MVWARFDDRYSESSKVLDAGPWAELLDMRAIIFSCRNETDGAISKTALQRIGHGIPAVMKKAAVLVEVGRWDVNPAGGWWVHDFLIYNPSKAVLEQQRVEGRERAAASKRARASGEAKPKQTFASSDRANGTGYLGEEDENDTAPPPSRKTGEKPFDFALRSVRDASA